MQEGNDLEREIEATDKKGLPCEAHAAAIAAVATLVFSIGIMAYIVSSIPGFKNKSLPKSIKGSSHVVMEYFKSRGYQPKFFGEGKDFDHDKMDDPYIQIKKGEQTITYATSSMNLVRGYEDINTRTWSRKEE